MKILPSLDAHVHLDPTRTAVDLADSGAVLAMTISLDEAALVVGRREPIIVWGVGCHPRNRRSQESFDAKPFHQLAEQTAVVGEIGLDKRSTRCYPVSGRVGGVPGRPTAKTRREGRSTPCLAKPRDDHP